MEDIFYFTSWFCLIEFSIQILRSRICTRWGKSNYTKL